jgi:cytochrome c nitrite reductase small subunit
MSGAWQGGQFRRGGIQGALLLAVAGGLLIGIGLFTFGYARGASYLTDDPAACANCHVMQEQYAGWLKSSHKNAAVCNDCHTPPGFFSKYMAKAVNGFFHSLAFTTQRFPDEIRITGRNFRTTNQACLKCHAEVVEAIRATRKHGESVSCIQCHNNAGHL